MSGYLTGARDWNRLVTDIPDDFALSVCAPDVAQSEADASWMITVCESGPVRIGYRVHGVRREFLHRCSISESERMALWRSVVAARLLEDGGGALTTEQQWGTWLAVSGNGVRRWVPLSWSGIVRDWPIVDEVQALVAPEVWHHIKLRRRLLLAERCGSALEVTRARAALDELSGVPVGVLA